MFLSTCITVLLSITYICYYLDGGEPFGGKPPFVTSPPEDMRSKSQGNLMREDERAKWQPGAPPGPTSPPDNRYGWYAWPECSQKFIFTVSHRIRSSLCWETEYSISWLSCQSSLSKMGNIEFFYKIQHLLIFSLHEEELSLSYFLICMRNA